MKHQTMTRETYVSKNGNVYWIPGPVELTDRRDPTGKNKHCLIVRAYNGDYLYSNSRIPAIGERIVVTINRLGGAIVEGYFIEHGYLGVLCRVTKPPAWYRANLKRDKAMPCLAGVAGVFGAEFDLKEKLREKKAKHA